MPALLGDVWSSTLVYGHYEGSKFASKTHNSDHLQQQLQLVQGPASAPCLITPEGAPDATRGKITTITACHIELGPARFYEPTRRLATHHFIQVKTDRGYAISIEKKQKMHSDPIMPQHGCWFANYCAKKREKTETPHDARHHQNG